MSIGYICKRGEHIGIKLASMLSRVPISFKPLNESYYNQKLLKEGRSVEEEK
jgi:hypothetical protein